MDLVKTRTAQKNVNYTGILYLAVVLCFVLKITVVTQLSYGYFMNTESTTGLDFNLNKCYKFQFSWSFIKNGGVQYVILYGSTGQKLILLS